MIPSSSALDGGDAKIGVMVLKSLGLLCPQPAGPTRVADVRKEQKLEKKLREKRQTVAEMDADFPV